MRCPKCGNNLNDNDRVCDFCGFLVIQESNQDKMNENNDYYYQQSDNDDESNEENKKNIDVGKIFFFIAILACLVYVVLVASKWFDGSKNGSKNNIDTTTQSVNEDNNTNNDINNDINNNEVKPQDGKESVIENNGYRYVIPAFYNVYKNTESYVELINNVDKVSVVMHKQIDMEYDLIKSAPESYILTLTDKGFTLIKNLEKFYNNNRYYVIYCKNGNNNFYQIFTSFYGKTLSFDITDYGTNEEDDLFDVIDMIITDATVIS